MMPPVWATTPGFTDPTRSLTLGNRMSVKICRSIASNIQAAQADTRAAQVAKASDPFEAGNRFSSPVWPSTVMAFSAVRSRSTLSRPVPMRLDQNERGFGLKRPVPISFDVAKPVAAGRRKPLMMPAKGRAAFFQFCTDGMPPHERPAAVRSMHERCTLPVKPEPMEPLSDEPVHVNITQWALPGLGMMAGALSGLRQRIKPEHSAPTGDDDVFLAFNLAGTSIVARRDDQVVVHKGDAFLAIRGARGFSVVRPKLVRFIGLRFPLKALAPLVPDLDPSEVRMIPHGSDALNLLRRYLDLI